MFRLQEIQSIVQGIETIVQDFAEIYRELNCPGGFQSCSGNGPSSLPPLSLTAPDAGYSGTGAYGSPADYSTSPEGMVSTPGSSPYNNAPVYGGGGGDDDFGIGSDPDDYDNTRGNRPGGAVGFAESQIGVMYHYGAEKPGQGFDCSGLTQWAWHQAGVDIPRDAQHQHDACVPVDPRNLRPGDLLFYGTSPGGVTHVAMYIGNGMMIEAPYDNHPVHRTAVNTSGLVGAGRPRGAH